MYVSFSPIYAEALVQPVSHTLKHRPLLEVSSMTEKYSPESILEA